MITINKNIVKDIKEYFNLYDYCKHFIDYKKEEQLNKLKENINNYFNSLNENAENSDNGYYYNDFYLSNESIETIITIVNNKLEKGIRWRLLSIQRQRNFLYFIQ